MDLREWLLSESCTHVAMESTGVYWKPIYAVLEGAFEIVVANAQHVKKVLKACDIYPNRRNGVRLKALTLLLRYSGLRIGDVVTLRKDRITKGVLTLRTAKTGTDVMLPLPPECLKPLDPFTVARIEQERDGDLRATLKLPGHVRYPSFECARCREI
jgi:hypothetical protein